MNSLTVGSNWFLDTRFIRYRTTLLPFRSSKQGLRKEIICSHDTNFFRMLCQGLKKNVICMSSSETKNQYGDLPWSALAPRITHMSLCQPQTQKKPFSSDTPIFNFAKPCLKGNRLRLRYLNSFTNEDSNAPRIIYMRD